MELAYRILGYDEGLQTLGTYDTQDPDWGWTFDLKELPMARDLQKISDKAALVGFDRGYFEIDLITGKLLKVIDRWSGITSVCRLSNGNTLLTGVDIVGEGICVITLDSSDSVIKSVTRDGDYVRLMRPTPDNTFLLGADICFLELSTDLKSNKKLSAPGFEHAWLAHRYPDGKTLVSAGYGAFMAVFDVNGELLTTFGRSSELPRCVSPFFYATFVILPGGGILVANWQGHGRYNGNKGRQLIEFDKNGIYLGSWSDPKRISSLQGIIVL